ncbi:hypothetical protein D3C71_1773800 [compost metagenome]
MFAAAVVGVMGPCLDYAREGVCQKYAAPFALTGHCQQTTRATAPYTNLEKIAFNVVKLTRQRPQLVQAHDVDQRVVTHSVVQLEKSAVIDPRRVAGHGQHAGMAHPRRLFMRPVALATQVAVAQRGQAALEP